MGEGVKGKRSGGGSKLDLVYFFFFFVSPFFILNHIESKSKIFAKNYWRIFYVKLESYASNERFDEIHFLKYKSFFLFLVYACHL